MPNNKTLYKAPRAAGMRGGFSAKKFGAAGEDIAAAYLKKHGWRVVARNYAENGGEIDIIGYKRGKLTFFEVKTRSNETFGRPADAVGAEKTARIKKSGALLPRGMYARRKSPRAVLFRENTIPPGI